MNKLISPLRRGLTAILGVAVMGVMLTSCLKNKDLDAGNPATPTAGLMSFNLAPDQQSIALTISGNSLTASPLAFTNFSGGYRGIYAGTRTVQGFDYPDTNPLASVSYDFKQDQYYSVYFVGLNGKYRNIISEDKFDSLSATGSTAYIRYINAIADTSLNPQVTITAPGGAVANESANFGVVTEFKQVNAGEVNIAVKSGSAIDANRSISVEANKVYTVLLVGIPGETSDEKKVSIRFIANGTVDNTTNK